MGDKKQKGGAREGAGRKTKQEEEKVNNLFNRALKELYSTDDDDEAKVKFIKDTLLDSQRGQIFVAEHVFGKPKDIIDLDAKVKTITNIISLGNGINPDEVTK